MSTYIRGTSRRFNSYAGYFRRTVGERLQKITINAGFTCPNRDGSIATGGCTYCNNQAFSPSYSISQKTITEQINEGIAFAQKRYPKVSRYLAYFQTFSNTYAPLEVLKKRYEEALQHPQIAGLVIGTRPDCVDAEKLDYLAQIATNKYVAIEYGLESCYDATLLKIHRGHTFEQARSAIEETARRKIHTGAHIIFGLPDETKHDMLNEAKILSALPLSSIKFHQLQIVKDTAMATLFTQEPNRFVRFELAEYIDFFIDFLELFNPNIIVERFAGEIPPRYLLHSDWGAIRNEQLLPLLDKRLEERNTWQGKTNN